MMNNTITFLTQLMKDEIRRLGDERRRLATENEILKAEIVRLKDLAKKRPRQILQDRGW